MGVAPVPGYGVITQGNAADIYKDKSTYDKLDPAQKHLVDRYVPQETRDEIDYETGRGEQNAYDSGKESIEGADKAESHEGQGKNAAATTAGNTIFAAASATFSALASKMSMGNVWAALAYSAGSLACSIGTKICSDKFDNAYKDRLDANSNAGATNETLNSHTEALENTMESMDEDVATYQEQQELLTTTTNNNASTGADLQAQIMDAEAAGDNERMQSLKEQLKAVGDFDYSQMEGDLEETKANLEQYSECNAMAQGARDGGQSVSDFLQEGKPLGIVAGINAALLAISGVLTAGCVAKSIAAVKAWWEAAPAAIAAAVFGVSAGILASSANTMKGKMSKELECGNSGKDMQGFVDNLSGMIDNQQSYIDQTDEDFTVSDEKAGEIIAEGEKNAAEVVSNATKNFFQEKADNNANNQEGNSDSTNQ